MMSTGSTGEDSGFPLLFLNSFFSVFLCLFTFFSFLFFVFFTFLFFFLFPFYMDAALWTTTTHCQSITYGESRQMHIEEEIRIYDFDTRQCIR